MAYLQLPRSDKPVPLVFGINGMDSREEDLISQFDEFLKYGIDVFAIDMPGTGQAPLLGDSSSERLLSAALD